MKKKEKKERRRRRRRRRRRKRRGPEQMGPKLTPYKRPLSCPLLF
jgi:hypothetical protein